MSKVPKVFRGCASSNTLEGGNELLCLYDKGTERIIRVREKHTVDSRKCRYFWLRCNCTRIEDIKWHLGRHNHVGIIFFTGEKLLGEDINSEKTIEEYCRRTGIPRYIFPHTFLKNDFTLKKKVESNTLRELRQRSVYVTDTHMEPRDIPERLVGIFGASSKVRSISDWIDNIVAEFNCDTNAAFKTDQVNGLSQTDSLDLLIIVVDLSVARFNDCIVSSLEAMKGLNPNGPKCCLLLAHSIRPNFVEREFRRSSGSLEEILDTKDLPKVHSHIDIVLHDMRIYDCRPNRSAKKMLMEHLRSCDEEEKKERRKDPVKQAAENEQEDKLIQEADHNSEKTPNKTPNEVATGTAAKDVTTENVQNTVTVKHKASEGSDGNGKEESIQKVTAAGEQNAKENSDGTLKQKENEEMKNDVNRKTDVKIQTEL